MTLSRLSAPCVAVILVGAVGCATPRSPPPSAAVCREAIVNPVSGYAECVRPPGAPVDPAPPRPDAAR